MVVGDLQQAVNNHATVHIWQTRLDLVSGDVSADEALLSPQERERAGKFRLPEDRRRFILRHAHLREVIANYPGPSPDQIRLETNQNEAPRLLLPVSKDAWRLSMSSSHDQAVVSIARRRVGVDIERIRTDIDYVGIAMRFFSPVEYAGLQAMPASRRPSAFFRTWVRKEAYAKAIGLEFSRDFSSFDVLPPDLRCISNHETLVTDRKASKDDPSWLIKDVSTQCGFALACCAEGMDWSIARFCDNDPASRSSSRRRR